MIVGVQAGVEALSVSYNSVTFLQYLCNRCVTYCLLYLCNNFVTIKSYQQSYPHFIHIDVDNFHVEIVSIFFVNKKQKTTFLEYRYFIF